MHIFQRSELLGLYAGDKEARVSHFENLLVSAAKAEEDPLMRVTKSVNRLKEPLQYYKDEPSITLVTFAALSRVGLAAWEELLKQAFPLQDWHSKFMDKPKIELEKGISPSPEILASLRSDALRHPVKYVRDAADIKKTIEGVTDFDAVITLTEDIMVFIEAKYTSDISIDTTHCTARNQLARCIDVGLAHVMGNIERFNMVLLTPFCYQKDPGSRLYYFKLKQYQEDLRALALDIPRLAERNDDIDYLAKISGRVAFLSWEQCAYVILKHGVWSAEEREWLVKFYVDRLLLTK
ncbi:hypothetical protein [Paenibacillus andongensis]|uniref:hypothetical protein n=1 Tax=Paenibacillus andongensis TaxID=2975482 RepID=UPI0021BB797E|nr:hypothetical protein [Paenibacillus andongensis]